MAESITIQAPAKINLWLRVLGRETSGYHSLETLFVGITLADEIEVSPGGRGIQLEVTGGVETGPPEKNLVVRAAARFLQLGGFADGIAIRLVKRIPSAAGLGGGSSDAAATLRAPNILFGEPLDAQALLEIGSSLGSDVPFFLAPTPCALAWGRGERLLSLPPLPEKVVVVANPGVEISTARAFTRLAELRGSEYTPSPRVFSTAQLGDWDSLTDLADNDLDTPALEAVPSLGEAGNLLREAGSRITLLSGSGASVFGIFDSDREVAPLRRALDSIGFPSWSEKTLQSWPVPLPRD